MIYIYDFASDIRFNDSEANYYIGDDGNCPSDIKLAGQYILDMDDRGAKVQFLLMDINFPTEYRVVTKVPIRYGLFVPTNKVLDFSDMKIIGE